MKNNNQHHKNLTGGSPKQVQSLGVFVKSTPDCEMHRKTVVAGSVDATMRRVSNQNLNNGCIQLNRPTITITSDVLVFLGYEGPIRSKLGRGEKAIKK